MKCYQVGGCVRDRIMGAPIHDRDWVVTGATAEDMQAAGYHKVGRDFAVFLHPETGEEYALARSDHDPHRDTSLITIEDDLLSRDLTINAMAMDELGNILDPTGGRDDIKNKIIRHVGSAFARDPVRVLRVARFAARWPDFSVADETLDLMRLIGDEGRLQDLQPERVWKEFVKALAENTPSRFFEVLRGAGVLNLVFPEIDALFGVPQVAVHHPEIDTGVHTMMVLDQAAKLSPDPVIRFQALVHDLGKALTAEKDWPKHHGHEDLGVDIVKNLVRRLRGPKLYELRGVLTARFHGQVHKVKEMRAGKILKLLEAAGAFKTSAHLDGLLLASEADARGRLGFEDRDYPQPEFIRGAWAAAQKVTAQSLLDAGSLPGPALAEQLTQQRVRAIKRFIKTTNG